MQHRPKIIVEKKIYGLKNCWCAECHEVNLFRWHSKSANHAIVNLLGSLKLLGYSGNREDYEIEIVRQPNTSN